MRVLACSPAQNRQHNADHERKKSDRKQNQRNLTHERWRMRPRPFHEEHDDAAYYAYYG